MVKYIRVALGTGVLLGFCKAKLQVAPTTAHLLTYFEGKCLANCKFAPGEGKFFGPKDAEGRVAKARA